MDGKKRKRIELSKPIETNIFSLYDDILSVLVGSLPIESFLSLMSTNRHLKEKLDNSRMVILFFFECHSSLTYFQWIIIIKKHYPEHVNDLFKDNGRMLWKTIIMNKFHPSIVEWNEEEQSIIWSVIKGRNLFITGEAGCGKTDIIKKIIKVVKNIYKEGEYLVTASTGVAAELIRGSTIHSAIRFKIMKKNSVETQSINIPDPLRTHTRLLILDEISMLSHHFMNTIDKDLKRLRHNDLPFGGIQLIFSGDFLQFTPITKEVQKLFHSDFWLLAFSDPKTNVVYVQNHRRHSDQNLIRHLRNIRYGWCPKETEIYFKSLTREFDHKSRSICVHNSTVNEINKNELERHLMDTKDAEILPFKVKCGDDLLRFPIHVPLVIIKTFIDQVKMLNGKMATVVGFKQHPKKIIIKRNDSEQHDEISERQFENFRLAYAFTIHKSQGSTFDRLNINLEGCIFENGHYVALTRTKTPEGMNVTKFDPSNIRVDRDAVKYYRNILKQKKLDHLFPSDFPEK